MVVQRNDASGNTTQIINVPISYEQKEKMLTRVIQDPNIQKQDAITLPAMSWFLDGMTYASDRKSATTGKYIIKNPDDSLTYQYKEVPWDFHFSLYIYVKNTEDANKMLEQILPYFTPNFTPKAFLIPNRDSVDLPIYLDSIVHPDMDSESFKENSILIWTLRFTLKGNLYGPTYKGGIIDAINVNFFYGDGPVGNTINNHAFGISNNLINTITDPPVELDYKIYVQPGVDANGQPTTLLANSIPLANITYNMDYGIIEVGNSTPWSN